MEVIIKRKREDDETNPKWKRRKLEKVVDSMVGQEQFLHRNNGNTYLGSHNKKNVIKYNHEPKEIQGAQKVVAVENAPEDEEEESVETEYEVAEVLDYRKVNGKERWVIKWKAFEENTLEPREHLIGNILFEKFEAERRKKLEKNKKREASVLKFKNLKKITTASAPPKPSVKKIRTIKIRKQENNEEKFQEEDEQSLQKLLKIKNKERRVVGVSQNDKNIQTELHKNATIAAFTAANSTKSVKTPPSGPENAKILLTSSNAKASKFNLQQHEEDQKKEKNKIKKKKIKKTKKAVPTKKKKKMIIGCGGNKVVVEKLKSGKNNVLILMETPSKIVDPLKDPSEIEKITLSSADSVVKKGPTQLIGYRSEELNEVEKNLIPSPLHQNNKPAHALLKNSPTAKQNLGHILTIANLQARISSQSDIIQMQKKMIGCLQKDLTRSHFEIQSCGRKNKYLKDKIKSTIEALMKECK